MADERWQRAKVIARNALKLEKPARAPYLESACGSDQSLLGIARMFVESDDENSTFLEPPGSLRPVLDWLLSSRDSGGDDDPLIDETIDGYLILRRLGQGGMAVVYEASEKELNRRVACKVIRDNLKNSDMEKRFHAERRILAQMNHPNIPALYAAGTTPDGRPYFAMEYVRGLPVTRFCDEQLSSLRSRLAMFIEVCRAVGHAHSKDVIHRDLKPSNILVGRENDGLRIKVIDFGIAKALTPDTALQAARTRTGDFIGTVDYMSPEQDPRPGLSVGAGSDIYSLSLVLYELLSGRLPFDQRELDLSRTSGEIRPLSPPPPSARLVSLDRRQQDEIARRRSTTARSLSRTLRGDLDRIVLKGLAQRSEERHGSAAALAAEVEKYLENRRGRLMRIAAVLFLMTVLGVAVVWLVSRGLRQEIPAAPPAVSSGPAAVERPEARLHICWQSVEDALLEVSWQDLDTEAPVWVLTADRNNVYSPRPVSASSGSIDLAPGYGLTKIILAHRCADPQNPDCRKPGGSEESFEPIFSQSIPPRDEKEACR